MGGGRIWELDHMAWFSSEMKPRCLYFMVDNLLHAISKLQCRYFHVVAKNSFCTPNTRVHTANIEMRPCIMCLLAGGLKQWKIITLSAGKRGFGHLQEAIIFERGFD